MAPTNGVELRPCDSIKDEVQIITCLHPESSQKQQVNYKITTEIEEDEETTTLLTQVCGTVSIAISGATIGTLLGFPGVTLPQLTDPDTYDLFLDTTQVALYGSLASLGSLIGCVISSWVLVRLGQRRTVLVTAPLMAAAWVWLSFSTSVWMVQLARVLIGMLMGLMSAAPHSYAAEIAHASVRGRLVTVVDVMRQTGFLTICLIGLSPLSWRQMALICGFITTIPCFITLWFMPDSPRWLAARGKTEEAEKSLRFFRGQKYNCKKELNTITEQLNEMSSSRLGTIQQIQQLMTSPIRGRFLNMCLLIFLSLFSGHSAIATYLVPVLKSANVSLDPYLAAVLISGVRVAGTTLAIFVADSSGRRFQLMGTWGINTTCLIVLSGYFYFKDMTSMDVRHLGLIPLISIVLLILATTLGQPSMSLIRNEIIPTSCRQVSQSIFLGILFFAIFVTSALFSVLVELIGEYGMFLTYSIVCMIFIVQVYITIPETKGKTLEAVNEIKLEKKKGCVNQAMESD